MFAGNTTLRQLYCVQFAMYTLFSMKIEHMQCNVCPRRLDPIYVVIYYIKWAKTSWTDSILPQKKSIVLLPPVMNIDA